MEAVRTKITCASRTVLDLLLPPHDPGESYGERLRATRTGVEGMRQQLMDTMKNERYGAHTWTSHYWCTPTRSAQRAGK